ncbi:cyclopropane fatty acyl phospholipid synthase [Marinimicrobium alkaliphilum]|uniref:cyclopropane fatty acyl phospholipid synthase n=1 Tax=Marinimicrobium alkaliphilum TaxID=2202654 RepID=UPI000DB9101E|nr:cyclopropane fatty acyl phospholipid synthase [Marinimicrobium alkaliphilum]
MPDSLTKSHGASATHARREDPAVAFFRELLSRADIRINGDRPWDIRVHDSRFFGQALSRGASLAIAEAYMQGCWDCPRLDQMLTRAMQANVHRHIRQFGTWHLMKTYLAAKLYNRQCPKRAFTVGEAHYDIGNDLYERMLDSHMMYSCAYWPEADNLEDAQRAKLDLICRKLELRPGMRLLDIGCGWGGLAAFAARHYGAEVVGITISREQQKLAQARVEGLPVRIDLVDYRSLTGEFDRIVSVGMFEHVGHRNYRTYFKTAQRLLADDGLFLLHTIGNEQVRQGIDPFLEKYIFPNGEIPTRNQINHSSSGLLRLEDWHNFGPDYDRTLMAWWQRFEQAWPELEPHYGEGHFYRMWKYYLHCCAAYFRSRHGQLWQLVYTQPGSTREYRSLR